MYGLNRVLYYLLHYFQGVIPNMFSPVGNMHPAMSRSITKLQNTSSDCSWSARIRAILNTYKTAMALRLWNCYFCTNSCILWISVAIHVRIKMLKWSSHFKPYNKSPPLHKVCVQKLSHISYVFAYFSMQDLIVSKPASSSCSIKPMTHLHSNSLCGKCRRR